MRPAETMPWYRGPSLLEYLESVPVEDDLTKKPFRLAVQWVNRSDHLFRGFSGFIASGTVSPGMCVRVLPSGYESSIASVLVGDQEVPSAVAGQSVTVTLCDELDVSRGDVLASANDPPGVGDRFEASIVWMHERPMLPGRSYLVKAGTRIVPGTVAPLKCKVNVDSLEHLPAKTLELNDIGVCAIALDEPVVFELYSVSRDLGGFILIDPMTNATVGAGLLHFALRRSQSVPRQPVDVAKASRAALKGQKPCIIWFTGLSGAGKSTLANLWSNGCTSGAGIPIWWTATISATASIGIWGLLTPIGWKTCGGLRRSRG